MNNADMPAMAHMEYNPDNQPIAYYSGLTKREYFAALAMQGMLSNPEKEYDPDTLTEEAVGHADWLLKALEG